ncbi:uncharacterized protein LOC131872738 [Cryptomeria japonica]|uniref:uncharacterized protein LOC131872738 n=1 Tax=Cryptomeria japonica TaxID=3369 RepID=UPI0027DA7C6F|nr:uncharacterized protein LOC131872738 [Cryptomeria japonica]
MQLQSDKSHRLEEIKTQFRAREGYYRLMNSPDYSQRSQRAMGFSTGTTNSNSSTTSNEKTCIKISLVTINEYNNDIVAGLQLPNSNSARDKKICFNVGRELFVYNYDGVRTGPDASNPIYKRSYKGSSPTCHDFNQATATSASIPLLVGFSHGQLQLIDLNGSEDQEACKEFNVDRLIDKTQVTCVKWLPNSSSLFLVAHASGQLYLYKDDLPCGPAAPTYQLYKQSEGVTIYTCKTKTTRNPIYKWSIGVHCSLNEFAFSPCAKYLACVSQDGFLRVYCYDTMDLVGRARSYYGGLSCVCWSPDGKYVVTGGEDDLITVWSFVERRVVARGIGHRSWVSVVAFDSFYTGYDLKDRDSSSPASTSYRFGSVGQDTQICLWDLTEDLLKQPRAKLKINSISGATSAVNLTGLSNNMHNNDGELSQNHLNQKLSENISRNDTSDNLGDVTTDLSNPKDNSVSSAVGFLSNKGSGFTKTFSLVGKRDKRNLSQRNSNKNQNSRNNSNILNNNSKRLVDDPNKLMGSPICPRMNEVPLLEPSVCKKIAFERLTSLIFCKGGFITSCQAGYVFSWARPSRRSLRISPGQSNEELRVIDVGTSSVV